MHGHTEEDDFEKPSYLTENDDSVKDADYVSSSSSSPGSPISSGSSFSSGSNSCLY